MTCSAKRCQRPSALLYLGRALCDKHWAEFCMTVTRDEEKAWVRRHLPNPEGVIKRMGRRE